MFQGHGVLIVRSINVGSESNMSLRQVSIGFGIFVGLREKLRALSGGTEMWETDGDILDPLEDSPIQVRHLQRDQEFSLADDATTTNSFWLVLTQRPLIPDELAGRSHAELR